MRFFWICLAALLGATPAFSHQMPKSAVLLDFRSTGVDAELQIPVDRLQVALRQDGSGADAPDGPAMLQAGRARVADYLLDHVHASDRDGHAWSVQLLGMEERGIGNVPDLVVRLAMRPPPGGAANVLDLRYDAVIRELVTHAALVSIRTDWKGGVRPDSPELVGAIGVHTTHLLVDRSGGSTWRGFRSIFLLGMNHIAEGTDHLLFLLTLLLPAPLIAAGGRWIGPGRPVRSVVQVTRIVTAFTVGHSLTLLLGALELVRVPEAPIEALVAVSILVSAIHALRPLFPGREFLIAGGFGLIHGLSFAAVICELGLDRWGMAVGILGFNLGIETMQLVVVLAIMPWLVLLATTRSYPAFRITGASFAAVAALGWLAERTTDWVNPVGPVVDALAAHATWLAATLVVLTLGAKALQPGGRAG